MVLYVWSAYQTIFFLFMFGLTLATISGILVFFDVWTRILGKWAMWFAGATFVCFLIQISCMFLLAIVWTLSIVI